MSKATIRKSLENWRRRSVAALIASGLGLGGSQSLHAAESHVDSVSTEDVADASSGLSTTEAMADTSREPSTEDVADASREPSTEDVADASSEPATTEDDGDASSEPATTEDAADASSEPATTADAADASSEPASTEGAASSETPTTGGAAAAEPSPTEVTTDTAGAVDTTSPSESERDATASSAEAEGDDGKLRGLRGHASLDRGLRLDAADGSFGVGLGFLGSLRYSVTPDQTPSHGFDLGLVRPALHAHAWGDRLILFVQPELAGRPRLLDATATVNIHPAFAVQVGQYRPWFTRGFRIGLPFLVLPDRGEVIDAFRIDRDLGATLLGRPWGGKLEYYVGVMNGGGLNAVRDNDPGVLVTGRIVGAPLGPVAYDQTVVSTTRGIDRARVAFAANATTNEVHESTTSIDPATAQPVTTRGPARRDVTVGGDFVLSWWRLYTQAEGYWRTSRGTGARGSAWGAYGLVSMTILPSRLDAAMRAGALRLESDSVTTVPLQVGLSTYLTGNHAKLQLSYGCDLSTAESSDCTRHRVLLQAQLAF